MAEPDQFALHSPVSPGGILGCHADDDFLIAAAVGGRPGGGVRCSPIYVRPACGARPGSWRE
jgi:hypothetical protein